MWLCSSFHGTQHKSQDHAYGHTGAISGPEIEQKIREAANWRPWKTETRSNPRWNQQTQSQNRKSNHKHIIKLNIIWLPPFFVRSLLRWVWNKNLCILFMPAFGLLIIATQVLMVVFAWLLNVWTAKSAETISILFSVWVREGLYFTHLHGRHTRD